MELWQIGALILWSIIAIFYIPFAIAMIIDTMRAIKRNINSMFKENNK